MTYKHIYRCLTTAGHSPQKAAEIILDAVRGNSHAIRWIQILTGQRQRQYTAFQKKGAQP